MNFPFYTPSLCMSLCKFLRHRSLEAFCRRIGCFKACPAPLRHQLALINGCIRAVLALQSTVCGAEKITFRLRFFQVLRLIHRLFFTASGAGKGVQHQKCGQKNHCDFFHILSFLSYQFSVNVPSPPITAS